MWLTPPAFRTVYVVALPEGVSTPLVEESCAAIAGPLAARV